VVADIVDIYISGKRDAVLVDTFITVEQADILVNWVAGERQEPDNDLCHPRTSARGRYDKMVELYPDRVNPGGALWLSARAVKS
jgi:hypothetical protein